MSELTKGLFTTVLASVLSGVLAASGSMYVNQAVNGSLLNRLSISTDKLSEAVTELKITVAAQREMFVTKDQLHIRLKEFKEELHNGT